MIIQASDRSDESIYMPVLKAIESICRETIDAMNPVNVPEANYQSIRQCLHQENCLHKPKWTPKHLARVFEIVACICIFRLKIPPLFFNPWKYANAMRHHADYRKFDDLLRMVLDVSLEQKKEIEALLKSYHDEGQIFYGLHTSDKSLMTCYVDDINDAGHIHFVDGAGGGYAIAAKNLKGQIKSTTQTMTSSE
jgi:hypothetical protein